MPSIFAEVRGDPLGARIFAERGRDDGVRLVGAARLAKRRDMIDVYIETLVSCWHGHALLGSPTTTAENSVNRLKVSTIAVGVIIAIAACTSNGPGANSHGQMTGAASPKLAVEQFLAAARAQDLQAFSSIWGSERGAARDIVDRSQLEKRELTMMCYLTHDRYEIGADITPKPGEHDYTVEITRGTQTRETKITAVQGPSERWYVLDVQLAPLQDLCSNQRKR